jgi:hypothetical protein
VKIKCYRKSASGSWVVKKSVWTRDFTYRTYTRYKRTLTLPSAGRWKLRAVYPSTQKYAEMRSGWRYVTAK